MTYVLIRDDGSEGHSKPALAFDDRDEALIARRLANGPHGRAWTVYDVPDWPADPEWEPLEVTE